MALLNIASRVSIIALNRQNEIAAEIAFSGGQIFVTKRCGHQTAAHH
jgi:hypothetical protein